MSRPRLIVVGPVPPPTHGVAISTSLVLANPFLREQFEIAHLDTSDRRTERNMGQWDPTNIRLGLVNLAQLAGLLRGDPGVVYLPLSENLGGFLRDSLFVQLASLKGWRVAAHIRNSTFQTFYGGQKRPIRWWIRATLQRLASVAVLGNSLRFLFDGLVPAERLAVVPNGTPDVGLSTGARDSHMVLYLSNLLRKKGVVEAVEAAVLIVERDPEVYVVFAGDWEDAQLERQLRAIAAPASDRIRFLPPIFGAEKERLFATCSVLLFPPAWGEGQPRIVLEALCRGIPLVTTNRASIVETVGSGSECAIVIEDPVPEKLAENVLDLLRDPERRDLMGRAGRRRYLEEFTQQKTDERLASWLAGLSK